ncbi:hypothetical protein EJP82_03935 [Paenibacillus anaericanus]|uniref:Uncharacterized protein n=1 Tax=Paenibacillus anaericanus TaxID=170367 RepID=A0A3S1DVJ0_9BACL|nr:endospore germination permease [Paenibacillus anaericanus]RUT48287.1 hypothetical protein EJP82_03935 [Paenibacillus anaericanus]
MLKVQHFQVFSLFTLYLVSSFVAFLVGLFIDQGQFSTPVGSLLGGVATLLLIYPAYKVTLARPHQFIAQYGHQLVGKVPHLIFMYIIIIVALILATSNLRELADFLILVYLSGTPEWVIVGTFGLCIVYAIRSGIPTIFRAAQGIFIISIGAFLIFPVLVKREVEYNRLPAMFTHLNLHQVLAGAFNMTTLFGAFSFLFLVIPYLQSPEKTYRTLLSTTLTSLIIIMAHLIPILLIFGPDLASNLTYPDLELIRSMRAGSFIETLDPVLMILWLICLYVKISFILYIAVICLTHITGMTDPRPLCLPSTAFCCILSIYFARSQPELNQFMIGGLPPLLFSVEFLIPTVYWISHLVRKDPSYSKGPPN